MTAPHKVDIVTESVISYMIERIAALEAENAELKTRINDLATDWQVLHLKLATARDAFSKINNIVYAQGIQLGTGDYFEVRKLCCENIKAIAAIGEAQPETLPTISFNRNGATMAEFSSSKCQFPKPASAEVKPIIDPNCTCDEHGACAYCWNGKKHDTPAQTSAQQPRQESEIAAEALEEAADRYNGPQAIIDWLKRLAAEKRKGGV